MSTPKSITIKQRTIDDILGKGEVEKELARIALRNSLPSAYSETMEFEPIQYNRIYQFISGQVSSAASGTTVLLTGITNEVLEIRAITNFKVAGTTQAWRLEIQTGVAFATTRIISQTDTNDKEMSGQVYFLESTERLVLNVTTAVAATTIDWTVSYIELGFGTVWS